ncbi:MAG: hypothetical protein JO344_07355 [Planctomycetaceae bacterium]|nr:hypothetical protein [Planctomycetaceae bacterium]
MICSEVLEHLADWPAAVANLVRMTRKHLLREVDESQRTVAGKANAHPLAHVFVCAHVVLHNAAIQR